jgi:hypothetical protein
MAVDVDVSVDARPCVEELWELEAGVPEHRHRRPRAQRLKLNMEEPSKNRSKASLSRTSSSMFSFILRAPGRRWRCSMRGKKRTGYRDHHDRSFQKPRSGQSNLTW